jgi:hypothetical protein
MSSFVVSNRGQVGALVSTIQVEARVIFFPNALIHNVEHTKVKFSPAFRKAGQN